MSTDSNSDEQPQLLQQEPQPVNVAPAYPPARQGGTLGKLLLLLIPIGLTISLLSVYKNSRSSMKSDESSIDNDTTNLAVCYTGHVGTFEKVYQQNEDVFDSLNSTTTSYFFAIDLEDNYKNARTGKHYREVHEKQALQTIFDQLKSTKSVNMYSSKEHLAPSHCTSDSNDDKDGHQPVQDDAGHFSSSFSTLYANELCYKQIEKYEEANNFKFDWVIRMRPDMQISVKIPADNVTKRIHLSGFAMALMPRSLAELYFSAIHAFDKEACEDIKSMDDQVCQNYSYDHESSECLLVKWLKRGDVMPSNGLYVNRRIVYPES